MMMNRANRSSRGHLPVDPTKTAKLVAHRRKWNLMLGGIITIIIVIASIALFPFLVAWSLWPYSDSATNPRIIALGRQQVFSKETINHAEDNNSPEVSFVECTINGGDISSRSSSSKNNPPRLVQITVRHDLSPIASRVFVDLVQARHFDDVFIFRVLKGFIAQWGIQTPPLDSTIGSISRATTMKKPDKTKDVVHANTLSNVRGTLSFAGGNPATCQVFVNIGNNQRLDQEGARPFATVSNASMQQVFDALYTGYPDGLGQVQTLKLGRDKMRENFPRMSRVEACRVVSQF
jgi:cyclophilin family peptidyl-prolyl cis-trans isomerase